MILLGIGELGVTNIQGEVLKTLALGSCVSTVFLHPTTRTIGMVHIALPDSSIGGANALERPGYFADTAIPALIAEMKKKGCAENAKDMIVKLAGGAQIMDPKNTFNIGKRNVIAIKKILWSYGMGAVAENVGGTYSRSVTVDVDTGRVVLSSPGKENWEI
ncbi:MAG: chemotaxis protein CheD [Pseudomonadota bacterium]